MGQTWVNDETALADMAPDIIAQEGRIARHRQLIDDLNAAGQRDRAIEAAGVLEQMCDALTTMRRNERGAAIHRRERSFSRMSNDDRMDLVVRDCPL
jgi:hypothetical protein